MRKNEKIMAELIRMTNLYIDKRLLYVINGKLYIISKRDCVQLLGGIEEMILDVDIFGARERVEKWFDEKSIVVPVGIENYEGIDIMAYLAETYAGIAGINRLTYDFEEREFVYDARGFVTLSPTAVMPTRATNGSAGYDLTLPVPLTIAPNGIGVVPFDVAAYMQSDEVLEIHDRSSNPVKKGIVIVNSVGIIDSDYYGNPENGGNIMAQFKNITDKPVTIPAGERVAQAIFKKYLTAGCELTNIASRSGGIGSTGK